MPRLVAFLRAVNVGGHTVTMEKLRGLFEGLGMKDVETFIASGNVIFASRSSNLQLIERKIEAGLQDALGYEVRTFVRTDEEVAEVARHRAFSDSQLRNAAS